MPKYYPGLSEALTPVDSMDEGECLNCMQGLYGTDNLRYGATLEEVREELRRQIREDFTDRSDPMSGVNDRWIKAMADSARGRS